MGELDKFKELPHINSLYEIVDDWGYAPNLYHFDGSWHVTWIHCEEGDGLDDFVGESPEEAINKAYEWYQNKFNNVDKAEIYIKEFTRHCSNELVPSGYHEWVTPDNALRACEIAKDEILDKVCEYLYDKLYTRANGAEHYVASKEKITQTEFVDKLRDYIGLESKNNGN